MPPADNAYGLAMRLELWGGMVSGAALGGSEGHPNMGHILFTSILSCGTGLV